MYELARRLTDFFELNLYLNELWNKIGYGHRDC